MYNYLIVQIFCIAVSYTLVVQPLFHRALFFCSWTATSGLGMIYENASKSISDGSLCEEATDKILLMKFRLSAEVSTVLVKKGGLSRNLNLNLINVL